MSSLQDLKDTLQQLSIHLYLEGNNLRVNAPKNIITQEIKQELKKHKQELLTELIALESDIIPVPHSIEIPLSIGQKRLWSLIELQNTNSLYNVPLVHQIKGPLNIEKLKSNLSQIQSRHAILRTSIKVVNGKPYLNETDSTQIDFRIFNIEDNTKNNISQKTDELLNFEIKHNFDLKKSPLWKCIIIKQSNHDWVLAITMHHIICDLFSKKIFLDELSALYNDNPLAPLTFQYKDYACWQHSNYYKQLVKSQLEYWKSQLQGQVSELQLPTDESRAINEASKGGSYVFNISDEITSKITKFCQSEKISMHMLLLATFNILLNRYSDQTDQIICSPFACRNKTSIEGLIGYFNNILPLRTDLSGNPTLREILLRVRNMTIDANRFQEAPFLQISEFKNLNRVPLTRAMFNFRIGNSSDLNLNSLITKPIENRRNEADFDLALYMGVKENHIHAVLDYNSQIFNRSTILDLTQNFEQILSILLSNPEQKINELPLFRKKFLKLEKIIESHPKVDKALVLIRSDIGHKSNKVVYLLLNEHNTPSHEELTTFINEQASIIDKNIILFPIDYFPFHLDGSIDLNKLPTPKLSRVYIDSKFVAPGSTLEKEIAKIWRRILWMDEKIGIHDDFFNLGGHSLLSVQMVIELEKFLNKPIHGLSQLSTIENLAQTIESDNNDKFIPNNIDQELYQKILSYTAAWNGKRSKPESLIVGLNTDGKKQAVFWCVQRYLNIEKISKGLGTDQPLYGMRSGHNIMDNTNENIKKLAFYYADEILEIQSSGPYILGGICQAAEIAFQIAIRLMDLGHEISLLGLQERFIQQLYSGPVAFFFGNQSDRNPYYHFKNPDLGWRKYYKNSIDVRLMNGKHGTYFSNKNITSLTHQMKLAFEQTHREETNQLSEEQQLQLLDSSSYQAEVKLIKLINMDDSIQFEIQITNLSSHPWLSSKKSGIYLGARWHDPQKYNKDCYTKYLNSSDIRKSYDIDLMPNSSIILELLILKPLDQNINKIEIDMVDEGISWFADLGSTPLIIELEDQ